MWRSRAPVLLALVAWSAPLAAQDTAGAGRIVPRYGDGRVWVRPLPFTPAELAAQLAETTPQAAIDSIVAEMIGGYLEAAAAGRLAVRPPSWTTTIGGQTVGVDPAWIHLGPVKVPAFLLGLIPLNVQANPQQAEQARRWAAMREMIAVQGARDAALDDLKQSGREVREEAERRREFERNQRTPPPRTGGGTP